MAGNPNVGGQKASKGVSFGATFDFSDFYDDVIIDDEILSDDGEVAETPAEYAYDPDLEHHSFSPMMTKVFMAVLEECLDQIDIVAKINKLPSTEINLEYVPLSQKYSSYDCEEDSLYMEWWQLNFKKMRKDVAFIKKTLHLTIDNLTKNSSYGILLKILQNYEMTQEEKHKMLISGQFIKTETKRIRNALEVDGERFTKDIEKVMIFMGYFKDVYNDWVVECTTQINVLKKWEHARQEQNSGVLKSKETKFVDRRKKNVKQMQEETRVHEEIAFFLEEMKKTYENEILEWMDHYDKQIDDKEIEINQMKIKIEKQHDELEALKTLYAKRERKMEDYIEHKRLKKIQDEITERQTHAAVRIQSWWRGTMYRKHLGPYKRKKKGAAGNKKGSATSPKKKK